jgi:xylulokinase
MFLSPLFAQAFATVTGTCVELYDTDGSVGAARGAGIGAGIYKNAQEAFVGLDCTKVIRPSEQLGPAYEDAFGRWLDALRSVLTAS